jgi:CDP-diacylglycerol---glycerol-3-phosphate 3-phosphatidyltransferase
MHIVSIYSLKPKFQSLLRPLVKMLYEQGVTANQVTLFACCISVALGLLLVINPVPQLFLIIPLWMFLRMAANAVDGMLAREFNQKSALGAYLNELTDLISDACLYLPFINISNTSSTWVWLIICLSIVVEYSGVLGVMVGASRRYDGPFGKSDRAFVFGVLALIVGLGLPVHSWISYCFLIMVILSVVTLIQRVRKGLQEIQTLKI